MPSLALLNVRLNVLANEIRQGKERKGCRSEKKKQNSLTVDDTIVWKIHRLSQNATSINEFTKVTEFKVATI